MIAKCFVFAVATVALASLPCTAAARGTTCAGMEMLVGQFSENLGEEVQLCAQYIVSQCCGEEGGCSPSDDFDECYRECAASLQEAGDEVLLQCWKVERSLFLRRRLGKRERRLGKKKKKKKKKRSPSGGGSYGLPPGPNLAAQNYHKAREENEKQRREGDQKRHKQLEAQAKAREVMRQKLLENKRRDEQNAKWYAASKNSLAKQAYYATHGRLLSALDMEGCPGGSCCGVGCDHDSDCSGFCNYCHHGMCTENN